MKSLFVILIIKLVASVSLRDQEAADSDLEDELLKKVIDVGGSAYRLINKDTDALILNETKVLLEPVEKNISSFQLELNSTTENLSSNLTELKRSLEEVKKSEQEFIDTYIKFMKEDLSAVKTDVRNMNSLLIELNLKVGTTANDIKDLQASIKELQTKKEAEETAKEIKADVEGFKDGVRLQFHVVYERFDKLDADIQWIKDHLKNKTSNNAASVARMTNALPRGG